MFGSQFYTVSLLQTNKHRYLGHSTIFLWLGSSLACCTCVNTLQRQQQPYNLQLFVNRRLGILSLKRTLVVTISKWCRSGYWGIRFDRCCQCRHYYNDWHFTGVSVNAVCLGEVWVCFSISFHMHENQIWDVMLRDCSFNV